MMRSSGAKQRVERAATELFAAKGIDGVSIAEIAAAAGVSQGALYRHYPSKEELAWSLFSTAYLRTGAELDAIRAQQPKFPDRLAAMVAHFCALYDNDPALFRFMLIAQHGLLPRIGSGERTPVDAVADIVADAMHAGEIIIAEPPVAVALIFGIMLQTAVFHLYGRVSGPLSPRAADLTRAAMAAITALGSPISKRLGAADPRSACSPHPPDDVRK
jgi:AcrR family transcriptional regulator